MNDTGQFQAFDNKQRLVDNVVKQVIRLIAESKLEAGSRLPPEMKLAEQIGVSRTVVREAMQILIAKGLVETHHGIGTIVRAVGGEQISDHLALMVQVNELSLDNLHNVRSILEIEIAGIAASQATPEEIKHLSQLVDQLERDSVDPTRYVEADGQFHRFLAQTAHNPLLEILLDSFAGIMKEVRLSVSQDPAVGLSGMPDHRRIMERVKAGDVAGARQAMQDHLKRAREIQRQTIGREDSEGANAPKRSRRRA
ncbi:MAG: FadR family transcriptional regulator [Acidobacteria bacterium]|nr:MAG: FadR family transcriptional regulator [Acidobacteriota bacterium]